VGRQLRQLKTLSARVALKTSPIISAELVQAAIGGGPGRLPAFDEARDEFTRTIYRRFFRSQAATSARLAKRNRTDFYNSLARHQLTPEVSSSGEELAAMAGRGGSLCRPAETSQRS
jgi:two-component system, NtrC family, response regulator GlrR